MKFIQSTKRNEKSIKSNIEVNKEEQYKRALIELRTQLNEN